MQGRVTRQQILEEFKRLPVGAETTTYRLARRLGCSEYQVRAGVSWLVLGGQLRVSGTTTRRDSAGRAYPAKCYQLTGREDICRVPHHPDERRAARERHSADLMQQFACGLL